MAFINQIINPGFGTGTIFGVPTTAAVNSTSTYTISSGLWLTPINNLVAGLSAIMVQTDANTTTATFTIVSGNSVSAILPSDGSTCKIVSTTTSVNVTLIRLE